MNMNEAQKIAIEIFYNVLVYDKSFQKILKIYNLNEFQVYLKYFKPTSFFGIKYCLFLISDNYKCTLGYDFDAYQSNIPEYGFLLGNPKTKLKLGEGNYEFAGVSGKMVIIKLNNDFIQKTIDLINFI